MNYNGANLTKIKVDKSSIKKLFISAYGICTDIQLHKTKKIEREAEDLGKIPYHKMSSREPSLQHI